MLQKHHTTILVSFPLSSEHMMLLRHSFFHLARRRVAHSICYDAVAATTSSRAQRHCMATRSHHRLARAQALLQLVETQLINVARVPRATGYDTFAAAKTHVFLESVSCVMPVSIHMYHHHHHHHHHQHFHMIHPEPKALHRQAHSTNKTSSKFQKTPPKRLTISSDPG